MKIYSVTDPEFSEYGKVVENVDCSDFIQAMNQVAQPDNGVIYEPSIEELEKLPICDIMSKRVYGEMPIQIGYCIGHNRLLNALEYHRDSEINIAATEAVLLLGLMKDVKIPEYTYDTDNVKAFKIPKGVAVEVYATTLHYAPCTTSEEGFKVGVVLPRGTNYPLKDSHNDSMEDKHLTAVNKWLLGHPDAVGENEPKGLRGSNVGI